jgi:hypothetical protein
MVLVLVARGMLLSPPETYHILLSSITTIIFTSFKYMKTGNR